jgi:hypothetical protein
VSRLKVPGYCVGRYRQQQQTATSPSNKPKQLYIIYICIYMKFLEELTMAALLQMPNVGGVCQFNPKSRVIPEKLTAARLLKKLSTFSCTAVFTRPHHCSMF